MKDVNSLPHGEELEVLKLIAQGNISKEVAAIRGTSVNTVYNQRKHMLKTTGAKSMEELVARYVNSLK